MKVALIGNVHGNLPALEAVLEHAQEQDIRAIWNVGDLVGFGTFPNEVIRHLQQQYVVSTQGRFDREVLRIHKRKAKWRRKQATERLVALDWSSQQLSKSSHKYLRFLSRELRLTFLGHRILLTHTVPGCGSKELATNISEKRLQEVAAELEAEVIVWGRTHRPSVLEAKGAWFVNPGSVGLPGDGDPRASYAIATFEPQGIQIQHHRAAYDPTPLTDSLAKHKLPAAFGQMFQEGRSLDDVLVDDPDDED
jgi:putative phosphoesterase